MRHICLSCNRNFSTSRGLSIHRASCAKNSPEVIQHDIIINNGHNAIIRDQHNTASNNKQLIETSDILNSDELIIERFGEADVQNLAENIPCLPKYNKVHIPARRLPLTTSEYQNVPNLPEIEISPQITNNAKSWGEMSQQLFVDTINSIYDEIVKY